MNTKVEKMIAEKQLRDENRYKQSNFEQEKILEKILN